MKYFNRIIPISVKSLLSRLVPRYLIIIPMLALQALVIDSLHAQYEYIGHFGSSGSADGQFNDPAQVALDGLGNILVVDNENRRVQNCNFSGQCTTEVSCTPEGFEDPWGVAPLGWGLLVVTDAFGDAVSICNRFQPNQGERFWVDGGGSELGQFLLPRQVAADAAGSIYIADSGNERIQVLNAEGEWSSIGGPRGTVDAGRFWEPSGIAVAANGNLVVADKSNDRIQVCTPEPTDPGNCIVIGQRGTEVGQFIRPQGVAVDYAGRIIVADTNNDRVQICSDPVCEFINDSCQMCDSINDWTVITGSVTAGDFDDPVSVATDALGNLAVSEYRNDRIQIFRDPNAPTFLINPGLNDHWYNPSTVGQGVYLTVFPLLGKVNITMFTYDTELPPLDAIANLGDPGQRWLNGLGNYSGNQATLNLSYNYDGLFDDPRLTTKVPGYGTAVLTFDNCNSGTFEYEIPSLGLANTFSIQRIVGDNIPLCLALQALLASD